MAKIYTVRVLALVAYTFVKLVERWTLDIRRIFEISPLEYSGIYYSS